MAEATKAVPSFDEAAPTTGDKVVGIKNGVVRLFDISNLGAIVATPEIDDGSVTLAKLAPIGTATLLGRFNSGAGTPELITVGAGLSLVGGELAATADGSIADDAVTLAKLANVNESTLLGRASSGIGDPEELSPAAVKSMLGLNLVENAPLSGFTGTTNIVTVGTIEDGEWQGAPLASAYIADDAINTQKIADGSVTLAKMASMTTGKLLGRHAGADGTPQEISLGGNMTLVDGVLDSIAAGGGGGVTDNSVTMAKLADIATSSLLGRGSAGVGDPEVISIGAGLTLSGGVLSAPGTGAGTYQIAGGGTNPELAPSAASGGYSLLLQGGAAGTVTQDGSGIHFNGSNNLAAASKTSVGTDNGDVLDINFTVANYVSGSVRVIVSGDSINNGGSTPSVSANGSYHYQVTLASTSSLTNEIRIQATGANGTNDFDITAISVKKSGVGSGYPSRSMQDVVNEFTVSVVSYGADPTGNSDDTAAFNAALASGARRIHVPAGTYNVDHWVINRSVKIFGDGRQQSVINITGGGDIHGMQIIGEDSLGRSNLIVLEDFRLNYDGPGQTVAGAGPGLDNWSGIYIQRKVLMRSVYVSGFTNDGIYYAPSDANEATGAGGTIDAAVFFSRMDNVWSKNNGRDGIWVRRGANANSFINCQFDSNGRYGFHHSTDGFSTYGNTIRDGQCSYNAYYGYYFESGTNIVTSGLYAEWNCSPNNTTAQGYQQTALSTTLRLVDFYCGDSIVRSWIGIGVLLSASTTHVRVPGFNSNTIQVWEGGRKLFGDT